MSHGAIGLNTGDGFFLRILRGDAIANAIDACVYYLSIASAVEGKRGRNPIPVGHYHSGNETDVDLATRCALLAECTITCWACPRRNRGSWSTSKAMNNPQCGALEGTRHAILSRLYYTLCKRSRSRVVTPVSAIVRELEVGSALKRGPGSSFR